MSYFKLILFSSLIFLNICSLIESKKLKIVFAVHRHGDRTPVYYWPTTPYNDSKYWPDGFGKLTNKGKQRMYSLGKYIRKRYKHFLTDNPREVYARSSEKERCLESVTLLLAGLYPPVNRWKWDNDLGRLWQPFPIHTKNISHDGLLCPEAICPLGEKESQKVQRSDVVKAFHQKHKKMIQLIEEKGGVTYKNHLVGRDMFSTLEILKINGLKLPSWVNNTVYENLRVLSDMAFTLDGSTKLLHRIRAGLLLKEITENIKKTIKSADFRYKILLYSTHDTFLSVFLSALRAFNKKGPPFGATVFLELYELPDHRHELQLHYLNDTTTERPHRLPFICGHSGPTCDSCAQNKSCLLEDFLDALKDIIPDNWEEECKRDKFNFKGKGKAEL